MRDKVIALAREVAAPKTADPVDSYGSFVTLTPDELVRFYQLARADMKEQCAKVCEEHWRNSGNAQECADTIRALEDV